MCVTAFAPATVSNVACGFDVLGFALDAPGDEVTARFTGVPPGVRIDDITGDDGRLPREAARNTAGVAAQALLHGARRAARRRADASARDCRSRAASAAAPRAPPPRSSPSTRCSTRTPSVETLIACALEGERLGAGSAHADNIAPAICGGFVLVRRASPPDIIRLPVPAGLTAVVVHPDLEIETARARALLGDTVPLADAIQQWANLGAFVDGLHRADFALIARVARRHDRRAAPRPARAGAGGDQAGRRRRRRARLQPVGIRPVAVRAVPRRESRRGGGGGHDRRRSRRDRRRPADLRVLRSLRRARASCPHALRNDARPRRRPTSLEWALFDGLAPDGGLYVPESIDPLDGRASSRGFPSRSLTEIGHSRAAAVTSRGELDDADARRDRRARR